MARWKVGMEFWWTFGGYWSSLGKESDFLAPAVALKGRYSNGFLLEQLEMKAKMGSHARKHTLKNGIRKNSWAFLLARAVQNDKCCILGLAWSLTAIWPRSHDGQDHRWCLAIFCPPMQQHVGSFVTPYLSFKFMESVLRMHLEKLFSYVFLPLICLSSFLGYLYFKRILIQNTINLQCPHVMWFQKFHLLFIKPCLNILSNPQISTQFLLG